MPDLDSEKQERFAVDTVRRLREAGFVAYWAGGCVRDRLMGRRPKDYDVATNATPKQIRELFGHRKTLAIGAAFGVITLLGPKQAGQIEIATFRRDAAYSDGRHPDSVSFSSAEEDASRRDFTINGLFYDPLEEKVIDFVGGREDLERRLIRAIGNPRERIAEDKLRMLRAVRFCATFDFTIDPDTLAAIFEMSPQINVVSAERIAVEMGRMLVDENRVKAVRLTLISGLAKTVLPEITSGGDRPHEELQETLAVMDRLADPDLSLALAALLFRLVDADGAQAVCMRWKLSNRDTDRTCWLVANHDRLIEAKKMAWSKLQPILIHPGVTDLLALHDAAGYSADDSAYCREVLGRPADQLAPQPLLTGNDLLSLGIPAGPKFKEILQQVRDMQLDGQLGDRDAAIEFVKKSL